MITVDSSVLVPALRQSHPAHEAARATLRQPGLRLLAHVSAETFAQLTRARPRVRPAVVVEALRALDERPITLSGEHYLAALRRCAEAALVGGAVYDALIAAAARESGLRLFSMDQRATGAYAAMGADHQLVSV
ncbi:MAG: PIN domain-containing protein [Candidatus Dormibacteraeota bacterium]|nr:PIN domain-containing protein [Candidatus Dormibacteraeota bacterium]